MTVLEKTDVHVTVDVCIFAIRDDDLMVLLVKREIPPFKGTWALPGAFVRVDETLEDAAKRVLKEKAGITQPLYLEQLYTYGDLDRDPRGRVITVAYFAFVNPDRITISENARWHPVYELPRLAFDHERIVKYAHQRLKYKLEYTAIALDILPELFTLTELQRVYEIILGEQLDKRNFRKKILSMGILEATDKYRLGTHRPARLYRFKRNIKKKKIPGFRWTRMEL